jgi:hypothetical protein
LFDEKVVSPTHNNALATTFLAYGTLPVMDGALWSGKEKAGMWPVLLAADGANQIMRLEGAPVVKDLGPTELSIQQRVRGGGTITLVCSEAKVAFTGMDGQGQPLLWTLDLVGGAQQKTIVQRVTSNSISYRSSGVDYQLKLLPDAASCQQLTNGVIRIKPDRSGKLVLNLDRL